MSKLRPVLLLEVNEVHWLVWDRALESPTRARLRTFFERAMTRTTHASEPGVLSPWITWPTLHRGVASETHGIRQLGQDVATFRGTPIWDELRQRGESIGICGSMQSWPPIDPGKGGFYVPDTFAEDERCVPRWVEPIQRLNLGLVRESGRTRSRRLPLWDLLRAVPAAVRARISARFALRAVRQIAGERRLPSRSALRPTFQALLFWDVFKRLFDARVPPTLSTFFTNHVASVMHRHWDALFPEDFGERGEAAHGAHGADAARFALDVLDEMIGDALRFQEDNAELIVVIASSMGQAAVHRDAHHGRELIVRDLAKLLARLGVPAAAFTLRLAMVPQVAAEVPDPAWRATIARELQASRSASGLRIFAVHTRGASVSITLGTPPSGDVDAGSFALADGTRVPWDEAGLGVAVVPAGTGNHIPEGSLAVVGRGIAADPSRASMALTDVKALLLELTDVRGAS